MDSSTTTTVIASFALGAVVAAGAVAAFLRPGQTSNEAGNGANGQTETTLSKKKKKKSKKTDSSAPTDPVPSSNASEAAAVSKEIARNVSPTQPKPVIDPVPVQPETDSQEWTTETKSKRKTANNSKSIAAQKTNQSVAKPATVEEPTEFPSLSSKSSAKKGKKLAAGTSYAYVAKTVDPVLPPRPVSPVQTAPGYMMQAKPVPTSKPSTASASLGNKDQLNASINKQLGMDSSESEDEVDDSGPRARVLKIHDNETLDDGWTTAVSKKAPTLRIISSSTASSSSHSFPVRAARPAPEAMTKTQQKNQRKAEKLKEEKEAMRILQEQRRQQYLREVAQSQAKEKAVSSQMSKGIQMEKQRLAAAAAAAASRKGGNDEDSWTVQGKSFWE
ncbi:hypothetical protein CcCBS67573_g06598 [Chytriomyces confervae]|uniref:Uncharacterized protein n=1 Tax=Chytriomyces confervae TaxID=246404 RepID=A0A507F4H8_9FUNG|nr:hypothetical protein HDU80_002233 [Chytriomyces hyalinus]TPX70288.1 hypothetical protein CcCBS67573_g06598 [Chytriomyces confervae]